MTAKVGESSQNFVLVRFLCFFNHIISILSVKNNYDKFQSLKLKKGLRAVDKVVEGDDGKVVGGEMGVEVGSKITFYVDVRFSCF